METRRDLATADPWRESLERSRARRGSPKRRRGRARLGAKGIAVFALLTAFVVSRLAGGAAQGPPAAAGADVPRAAVASARAGSPTTTQRAANGAHRCALAIATDEYVNPLANATVKAERIDQGVDYAGSGTLVAIGSARVTFLATSQTGWPGAFIEYRLLGGADAGCYVFYAEGVIPAKGLHLGETIAPGQPIATIIPTYPTGIEIGWGAGIGTKTYARLAGHWSAADDQENVPTVAGRSFSALIAGLGGPPGKVEG